MPYNVRFLLEGKDDPITIRKDEKVLRAVQIMFANDFSQLPVVNEMDKP